MERKQLPRRTLASRFNTEKSTLRLKKLINEVWHTDSELVTDENGYTEFRGFYVNYNASGKDFIAKFGIHKVKTPMAVITL